MAEESKSGTEKTLYFIGGAALVLWYLFGRNSKKKTNEEIPGYGSVQTESDELKEAAKRIKKDYPDKSMKECMEIAQIIADDEDYFLDKDED